MNRSTRGVVAALVGLAPLVLESALLAVEERRVATFEPERPVAGAAVTLAYDTEAPGAALGAEETIYASIWYWDTEHDHHRAVVALRPAGKRFAGTWQVPSGAAVLTVTFTTLREADGATAIQVLVRRGDGEPVRTAWEQSMLSGRLPRNYLDLFTREVALYPDNFAAYRNKWFVAGAYDRETRRATIEKDLRRLAKKIRGEPVEGLYALAVGQVWLADEARALTTLRRMVALYPGAPLTAAALSAYAYEAYAQSWPAAGRDEMAALRRQILVRYPEAQATRNDLGILAADASLPVEALETAARSWMRDSADDPMPLFYLANGYRSRNMKLEEASNLAHRAVDGMLRGRLRPWGDPSGSMETYFLPEACLLAARIDLALDRPADALGYSKLAASVASETSADPWLIQGDAWESLHEDDAAEIARLEAYRRGSKAAEKAMREAWMRRHGGADGFEAYLAGKVTPSSATAVTRSAPEFSVTSLDGSRVESSALRGKVVVLNFWGTGCGPCKAEIPELNRLVERYRGREVVFLALTGESREELQAFLGDHPFAYRIVPAAGRVFNDFEVMSLPVHVVIGSQGELLSRLNGAGEARAEQIARIIDQALAARIN